MTATCIAGRFQLPETGNSIWEQSLVSTHIARLKIQYADMSHKEVCSHELPVQIGCKHLQRFGSGDYVT